MVGAGHVGLRRARGLLEAGARVTVVSPQAHPEVRALDLELVERAFVPSDLEGVALAFACTNDEDVNDAVLREAEARGLWASSASRPERASMRLGATLRSGDLLVAIQTGADLPYLSQALRDKLSAALPSDLPIAAWSERRAQALTLPEPARSDVLASLKDEIRKAVGA